MTTHPTTATSSFTKRPMTSLSSNALSPWSSFSTNFISGGVALATAFAIMHPLDTLKTRAQASSSSSLQLKSLFNPDTLKVLRKGFFTSVLGAGPQGGLRLATYEFTKSHLLISPAQSYRQSQLKDPSLFMCLQTTNTIVASALCAIMGDFVSSIVKVPREIITARLQTDHGATLQRPTTMSGVVKTILQEDGPKGLFRGFWSTTLRDWPFMVILFTTYESFKHVHLQSQPTLDTPPQSLTLASTLFGGVSGALAGLMTTPFDVVKTRVMTFKKSQPHDTATMRSVIRIIIKERAPSHTVWGPFFTGGLARSTWWQV